MSVQLPNPVQTIPQKNPSSEPVQSVVNYLPPVIKSFGLHFAQGMAACGAEIQPTIGSALLLTAATRHLANLVNAGAGGILTRNKETLAESIPGNIAANVANASVQNPQVPISQLLTENQGALVLTPLAIHQLATSIQEPVLKVQNTALSLITLLSRTQGAVLGTYALLEKVTSWGTNTPALVKTTATAAFHVLVGGAMTYMARRAIQDLRNSSGPIEFLQNATKIAMFSKAMYSTISALNPNDSLATNFRKVIVATRNYSVLLNYKLALPLLAASVLGAGLVGGVAGITQKQLQQEA